MIAEVTAKMAKEGISKDRKNQQQGYNFRGIDDVYNVLGSMFGEVGLVIVPRVVGRDEIERQTKSGGALFYVVTDVEYDLIFSLDSSKHVAKVMGEAMDSADKATKKPCQPLTNICACRHSVFLPRAIMTPMAPLTLWH